MDLNLIVELIGVIIGGGLGALIMQLYTARENKKKIVAEIEESQAETDRKKQDTKQDAFDTMYIELNKCMADYTALSEEYREHRERVRKYEDSMQEQIHEKCIELAQMKAKLTYLKGIRCYNIDCPNRIKVNPDKHSEIPNEED